MNLLAETLILIMPIYTVSGDSTYLKTTEIDEIYEKTITTMLRRLHYMTSQDPKAIRKKFADQGIKQNPPLLIGDDIYVKIKVRKPRTANDKAYGYVNTAYIDKVLLKDEKTVITLTDGTDVEILDSYSTISKNITIARSVEI